MSDDIEGADIEKPKVSALVSQKVDVALKQRIKAIHKKHGVPEAVLLRDSLDAICTYIETQGGYNRPVRMVWDHPAAHYGGVNEAGADPLVARMAALFAAELAKRDASAKGSPRERR